MSTSILVDIASSEFVSSIQLMLCPANIAINLQVPSYNPVSEIDNWLAIIAITTLST